MSELGTAFRVLSKLVIALTKPFKHLWLSFTMLELRLEQCLDRRVPLARILVTFKKKWKKCGRTLHCTCMQASSKVH